MSERDLAMNKQVNRHGVKQKLDKDWLCEHIPGTATVFNMLQHNVRCGQRHVISLGRGGV